MYHRDATTILLVEDSLADVELIRSKLDEFDSTGGKFVLQAADCLAAASERIARERYDLVLLDLGLPDSHGIGSLRRFVRDHAALPVIILTGMTDEDLAVECVNSGAQDFLLKDRLDARMLRRSIRYSLERHQLECERQRLSAELLNVISDEQQRIARELHDEVGQGLAGLNMIARSLAQNLRLHSPSDLEKSQLISEGIQDVLDSFRRVLCGLSPVDLDEQALPVALRRLCESIGHTGVSCQLHADESFVMDDNTMATHLYRIAQESLTNAIRHANATTLDVSLTRNDRWVTLCVADDGGGFDFASKHKQGMGLRILDHRSRLIGGTLSIVSGHSGTTVKCEVESYEPK